MPAPPIRDDESGHCSRKCPYLIKWEHPFWNETAWCDLQMRDLSFHDGYLADCIDNKPHPLLTEARDKLRFNAEVSGPSTRPPGYRAVKTKERSDGMATD